VEKSGGRMNFGKEYIEIIRELHKLHPRQPEEWRRWDAFFNDDGFGIILNHHEDFEKDGIYTMIYSYNSNEKEFKTYTEFDSNKYETGWCWVLTRESEWMQMDSWMHEWSLEYARGTTKWVVVENTRNIDLEVVKTKQISFHESDPLLAMAKAWQIRKVMKE
jgi:hypothetical protein